MQGWLSKETFQEIYDMLNRVDHVPYDCGVLCQKACCQRWDEDLGIYLLPNEDLLLREEKGWLTWERHRVRDYDFPPTWQGQAYFIKCNSRCPREKRPMQCRTFPLAPHLADNGELWLIWETLQLPYSCPLLERKEALNKEFVRTLYRAWQILLSDPLIEDLVSYDSRSREEEGAVIEIVYRPG